MSSLDRQTLARTADWVPALVRDYVEREFSGSGRLHNEALDRLARLGTDARMKRAWAVLEHAAAEPYALVGYVKTAALADNWLWNSVGGNEDWEARAFRYQDVASLCRKLQKRLGERQRDFLDRLLDDLGFLIERDAGVRPVLDEYYRVLTPSLNRKILEDALRVLEQACVLAVHAPKARRPVRKVRNKQDRVQHAMAKRTFCIRVLKDFTTFGHDRHRDPAVIEPIVQHFTKPCYDAIARTVNVLLEPDNPVTADDVKKAPRRGR